MAVVTSFKKAQSLMRDDGWRMRVTMYGEELVRTEIFHPGIATTFTVRKDSAKKLFSECMVFGRETDETAIMCYDNNVGGDNL